MNKKLYNLAFQQYMEAMRELIEAIYTNDAQEQSLRYKVARCRRTLYKLAFLASKEGF